MTEIGRRSIWPVVALVSALAFAACGGTDEPDAAPDQTAEAPATPQPTLDPNALKIRAGINDPQNRRVAILEYLPETVTVAVNSPVGWTMTGPEPHTVTFLPATQTPPPPGSDAGAALTERMDPTGPYDGTSTVNSGLGPMGPEPMTFQMSFEKAGRYSYFCVIHPMMTGTVTVVDDTTKADTQAAIDRRGAAEEAKWLEEGRDALERLTSTKAKTESIGSGATRHWVEMGTGTEHVDVLAFQAPDAKIKAGDEVVFVNNSSAPHTATFGPRGDFPADVASPEAQEPAPGPGPQTLNADAYFNTGWLPPNVPPGRGPPEAARSYTYKVPSAGSYAYVCLPHEFSGMTGVITAT